MGRSFSLVSLLLVTGLPLACSFSKATDEEIRRDGGSITVDVRLPTGDGNNTFESDATVTCVTTNPMTTNLPPDVLIVFDRSGSMEEGLDGMACMASAGCMTKWVIATTTMNAFLPTAETTVNWGLKLFGSSSNGCNVTAGAEVAPRTMNAAMISSRLGTTRTGSSTPTTAALMNAANYLRTLTNPNPKFILLVTDGIPTCGTAVCAPGVNSGGGNLCDDANAIAMVKTVHDMGYPTFVLGVGTSNAPGDATLSEMAVNGGFPRNDTPKYYPINSASDLTAALDAVTSVVKQCFFSIIPALTSGQTVTTVTADGVNLAPSDYMIVGATGIQLVGQKCDEFTNGTLKNITVQVSCNG